MIKGERRKINIRNLCDSVICGHLQVTTDKNFNNSTKALSQNSNPNAQKTQNKKNSLSRLPICIKQLPQTSI